MSKSKFFIKWFVVFAVLSIWTLFVVNSLQFGSSQGIGLVSASDDFNIPIYKQTDSGMAKMSSKEIIELLFKKDFSVEKTSELVAPNKCTIRASGEVMVGEETFTDGDLSFN